MDNQTYEFITNIAPYAAIALSAVALPVLAMTYGHVRISMARIRANRENNVEKNKIVAAMVEKGTYDQLIAKRQQVADKYLTICGDNSTDVDSHVLEGILKATFGETI